MEAGEGGGGEVVDEGGSVDRVRGTSVDGGWVKDGETVAGGGRVDDGGNPGEGDGSEDGEVASVSGGSGGGGGGGESVVCGGAGDGGGDTVVRGGSVGEGDKGTDGGELDEGSWVVEVWRGTEAEKGRRGVEGTRCMSLVDEAAVDDTMAPSGSEVRGLAASVSKTTTTMRNLTSRMKRA